MSHDIADRDCHRTFLFLASRLSRGNALIEESSYRYPVKAGSDLKIDHRVARKLESVLRVMAAKIMMKERPSGEDLGEAISLMVEFVDSYHHAKEERSLFPKVQGVGKEQQKVIYGFLVEHEFGRRAAHRIEQEYALWVKGEEAAVEPLARFILTYADSLKVHTAKEDEWFNLVDGKLLSASQQKEVLERFALIGAESPQTREDFGRRVRRLSKMYLKE
jgi:hemerythrin-like domain-containing protein